MATLDEIAEVFSFLDDWDQRYQYLIELGDDLEAMPESEMIEENNVKGCMSQVYVCAHFDKDNPGKIKFHADCDTATIKGVIALLVTLCNDKTNAQIQAIDVDEIMTRLDLADHLSPSRHVGIYGIVEMMKEQARNLTQ